MTIDIATLGFWMHDEVAVLLGDGFRLHKLWNASDLDAAGPALDGMRAILTYAGAQPVGRALLDRLPALELIVVMGAGIDAIDVQATSERGITVLNTPGTNADDVAELAIGLMIAAGRGIVSADAAMRAGDWINRTSDRLSGRPIGLLGMGNIGKAIARRAAAFDMPVHYHARTPQPDLPYDFHAEPGALARAVDVLVVAAPATPETYHVVDNAMLTALGPRGILVNIARGSLVDEDALLAALSEGRLGAAGLDVFEHEPVYAPAFRTLPNVVLSPHNGANTFQAFAATRMLATALMRAHFEQEIIEGEV